MYCDTDKLRFDAPSWFPHIGYLSDNKYWNNIPTVAYFKATISQNKLGMFTYVPTDQAYSASNIHMKLPAWGAILEVKKNEARIGRDIISDFGFCRCLQFNVTSLHFHI